MYFCVSITTINKKWPWGTFALKYFFFSNLNTIQFMEVKLGTHVHFRVSKVTINKRWPCPLFCMTTSLLLKLSHGSYTKISFFLNQIITAANLLVSLFCCLVTRSGRKRVTDRQTDTQTYKPTVTLAAHLH